MIARRYSSRMAAGAQSRANSGFTLIELFLALAITIVIATLIGVLINLYVGRLEEARETTKQTQLARAIMSTIGDDIRNVIRYQPYDAKALEEVLKSGMDNLAGGGGGAPSGGGGAPSGSGGAPSGGGGTGNGSGSSGTGGGGGSSLGGGNGGSSGGGASGGSGASGMSGGASSGSMSTTRSSSSSMPGSSSSVNSDSGSTEEPPLPPGIYGGENWIQIDVSRLPRPDEYVPMQANPLSGTLTDLPSSAKTVTYFVQSTSAGGVVDVFDNSILSDVNGGVDNMPQEGGLVRRQIDRSVLQWATANASSFDQINRTGQLVAPEVVGLTFSYFDGQTWTSTWDSSLQGLPWVVLVNLAIQDARGVRENPLTPGINVAFLTPTQLAEYRVRVYQLMVSVPGATLLALPTQTDSSGEDTGMSSVGL